MMHSVGDTALEDVAPEKREQSNIEPFSYHCLPGKLFETIIMDFQAASVLDLSPADGEAAIAAVSHGVKYPH